MFALALEEMVGVGKVPETEVPPDQNILIINVPELIVDGKVNVLFCQVTGILP